MSRFYKAMLRFYPADHAAVFALEMAATFEKRWEEHQHRGPVSSVLFIITELAGLIAGAWAAWMDKWVRGRRLSEACLTGAQASTRTPLPADLALAQERVTFLVERMVYAIAHHDFQAARSYSYQERSERENLRVLRQRYGIEH